MARHTLLDRLSRETRHVLAAALVFERAIGTPMGEEAVRRLAKEEGASVPACVLLVTGLDTGGDDARDPELRAAREWRATTQHKNR
ncbi:MAG: hypothetical protein R3F49_15510 [Planctomycetota bacterium]